MHTEKLKALQTPLKEKYRVKPEAAWITLKATGVLGENISCKLDTGRAMVQAGLHPATGGDGSFICSGDMLLEALVACAGVTLGAVSTSLGIEILSGKLIAEGDIDFRGTLGVSKEVPIGFKAIRLFYHLETSADKEAMATLLKLTERYCVVLQTIKNACEINTELVHVG